MTLDAGEIGTIKARIEAQRTHRALAGHADEGELHAQTAELGFISLYAPEIDRVAGSLEADLAFTGTLGTPLIDGTLKLSDGRARSLPGQSRAARREARSAAARATGWISRAPRASAAAT